MMHQQLQDANQKLSMAAEALSGSAKQVDNTARLEARLREVCFARCLADLTVIAIADNC